MCPLNLLLEEEEEMWLPCGSSTPVDVSLLVFRGQREKLLIEDNLEDMEELVCDVSHCLKEVACC